MSKIRQRTDCVNIEQKIFLIRGHRVMMDRDLAELYGVTTGALNQAIKRNRERFPGDFMFRLTKSETGNWMSQIVISNSERMGIRWTPYALTENGVAMLSSVLRSRRAIQVNIEIMRTFTKLRQLLLEHKDFWKKIEGMEKKYDKQFQVVFQALRGLIERPEEVIRRKIGFHPQTRRL